MEGEGVYARNQDRVKCSFNKQQNSPVGHVAGLRISPHVGELSLRVRVGITSSHKDTRVESIQFGWRPQHLDG